MTPDPQSPERLLSVPTEAEAAAIAMALSEYDIEAITTGGYTSGFRAEAPGNVTVIVKHADLPRARQALEEIRTSRDQIDWSNVTVAETPETAPDAEEASRAPSIWFARTDHLLLALALLSAAVGILAWLFGYCAH